MTGAVTPLVRKRSSRSKPEARSRWMSRRKQDAEVASPDSRSSCGDAKVLASYPPDFNSRGNARLTEVMARALAEMERILHLAVDLRDATDLIIRDHVALVEALAERDGPRARAIAERHLEASRRRVLQAIVAGEGAAFEIGPR